MDGEELDRLLLDEAAARLVNVALAEVAESAVAPRIAAAEAHDWEDGSTASPHESEAGPPIAAS